MPSQGRPGLLWRLAAAECGAGAPLRTLPEYAALAPRAFAALNVEHSRAPAALLDLAQHCAAHDALRARTALLALSTACHFTSDGNAREQPDALAAQRVIVGTGGWHTLVQLLAPEWDAAAAGGHAAAHITTEVRAEAAAILRELCFGVCGFAEALSECGGLPQRLLELCATPELFATASALLEEVATASRATLRVAALPRFREVTASLSAPQLASFCRVLAVLVCENEVRARAAQRRMPRALARGARSRGDRGA